MELAAVEAMVLEVHRLYGHPKLVLDPWQGAQLAQRLRGRGVQVEEFTFSQSSIGRLALTLFRLLRDRLLDLPDDAELLDELCSVQLRETQPGVYRLDHVDGFHDDRAVSLALAAHSLLSVNEVSKRRGILVRGGPDKPGAAVPLPAATAQEARARGARELFGVRSDVSL